MKIMIDLNVIFDVVQKRQPHYQMSAQILDFALKNQRGNDILYFCFTV